MYIFFFVPKHPRVESKYCQIIQASIPSEPGGSVVARALMNTLLGGIGAARTATCVRREIMKREEMINIWRALSGLPEWGVG